MLGETWIRFGSAIIQVALDATIWLCRWRLDLELFSGRLQPRTGKRLTDSIQRLSRPHIFELFCAIHQRLRRNDSRTLFTQFPNAIAPPNSCPLFVPQFARTSDASIKHGSPTDALLKCSATSSARYSEPFVVGNAAAAKRRFTYTCNPDDGVVVTISNSPHCTVTARIFSFSSSYLAIAWSWCACEGCTYRMVTRIVAWPRISLSATRSTPASTMRVANVCRRS